MMFFVFILTDCCLETDNYKVQIEKALAQPVNLDPGLLRVLSLRVPAADLPEKPFTLYYFLWFESLATAKIIFFEENGYSGSGKLQAIKTPLVSMLSNIEGG